MHKLTFETIIAQDGRFCKISRDVFCPFGGFAEIRHLLSLKRKGIGRRFLFEKVQKSEIA